MGRPRFSDYASRNRGSQVEGGGRKVPAWRAKKSTTRGNYAARGWRCAPQFLSELKLRPPTKPGRAPLVEGGQRPYGILRYGKTLPSRKREQAPALHRNVATVNLDSD